MAKKCLNAGDLRNKIVVQQENRTSDGGGGYTRNWVDVLTAWAAITPVKQYERITAMQTESPITHHIYMRYDSRVTTAMRIKFAERIFNIKQAINMDEAGIWLDIIAEEGTAT